MSLGISLSDDRRELWVEFLTGWFQPQTWKSVIYLLLGLPLGIAYFTFLVTGFSVGAGLIVIYVGFPVLALTLIGARLFCQLEARLANELQGADIVLPPAPWSGEGSVWARTKRTLMDRATWRGVVFLFAMFPIGIATFTVVVTLVSVAFGGVSVLIWSIWSDWHVNWQLQAVGEGFFFVIGVLLVFASPHIINPMASAQSRFAHAMLSDPEAAAERPASAGQVALTPEARRDRAARNHALAIKSFYVHASLYAAVNALLLLIDLVVGGGLWFYWSVIGWGAGLAVHGAAVYLPFLGGGWDERKTEELLREE